MECLYPDRLEELSGVLAHHFSAAGEDKKALDYLLRAGERAQRRFAIGEAIAFLRPAEKIARDHNWPEQLRRALEGLGDAHRRRGENEPALANYQAALELCEDNRQRADLYNRIGYIYHMHMNNADRGLADYGRAIEALGEDTESVEMARVSINLGYAYIIPKANHALAEEHLNRARRILEKMDAPWDLAFCCAYLAFAKNDQGLPQEGLAYGQRALDICQRFGLDHPAEPANTAIGNAYRRLGLSEQAIPFYEAARDKKRITGEVMSAGYVHHNLAFAYLLTGRHAQAIETGREALAAWEKLGHALFQRWVAAMLSAACSLNGQPGEAGVYLEKSLALARHPGLTYYDLTCFYALAGHRPQALEALRQAAPYMDDNLRSHAQADKDLDSLRGDPEFQQIMGAAST